MKLNTESNRKWRNSSVRKKFYHTESFDSPDTIADDTAAKKEEDKGSRYDFVVPWQMD